MESCHDVASIVTEESLELIREPYNIPKEYVLRAPLPSSNPESTELSISVDAFETGSRFPLHPTCWLQVLCKPIM
ncbi:hypothetical protein BHM03_00017202 [Ensete ventricosum]|nr:hypothetical protein BHM03_00017202 [Ensete ventricosum]